MGDPGFQRPQASVCLPCELLVYGPNISSACGSNKTRGGGATTPCLRKKEAGGRWRRGFSGESATSHKERQPLWFGDISCIGCASSFKEMLVGDCSAEAEATGQSQHFFGWAFEHPMNVLLESPFFHVLEFSDLGMCQKRDLGPNILTYLSPPRAQTHVLCLNKTPDPPNGWTQTGPFLDTLPWDMDHFLC